MTALRRSVDVAIVGAGTAGLAAYHAAAANAARVVLIESGPEGTTCARLGCMPSKLLVAAADVAHAARCAAPFGVACTVQVDGRAVMARVRHERDRFAAFVTSGMARMPAEHKISGRARFAAPGLLEIDGQLIEARAIVVAVGSTPSIPSMFPSDAGDRLGSSDDVFSWTTLPESVAVFGTGGIGLELGQALQRLGTRVHTFGLHGRLGFLTDPVVRAALEAALRSEMAIDPEAKVRSVRRGGRGVDVEFEDRAGRACRENFAFALIATGREPNITGLGLENAGVALNSRGVPLFDGATLQCGSAPVFIAGDAGADVSVQHEAADEGKVAGENAARYPDVRARPRRSPLRITFCDPQFAMVGASFEALSAHGELVIGEVSFEKQGRSRIMGQHRGIGRLYADRLSGQLLGAELCGPRAEHLAHLLAWAHQQELTIDQMLAMPIYHPVVEEGIRTALQQASSKLRGKTGHVSPSGR